MKMKSLISITSAALVITLSQGFAVFAQDSATTDDVYELILRAVPVIQELGQEGLDAISDPKGEFVKKGAYVYVIDCATMKMVAHPAKKLVGLDLSNDRDKNPDPAKVKMHSREMCELSKLPSGGWLEYYWNKLGSEEVARKVGFVIGVPGTSYALMSAIYDDTSDVAKLNASLK